MTAIPTHRTTTTDLGLHRSSWNNGGNIWQMAAQGGGPYALEVASQLAGVVKILPGSMCE
jgi:hypothetical protein